MKKSLIFILLLYIVSPALNAQQCLTTKGCTTYTIEYPKSGSPYSATTSWQVLKNPVTGNDALMNGGNYTRFNVTSGNVYEWTYCEQYGGTSTSWDAQLTLLKSDLSSQLCFSTDVCGTKAPYIQWTANFTGIVCLLSTAFVNGIGCQSNSSTYNKLAYRMISGSNCTAPGTPATALVSSIGQTSANLSWTAGSPTGSSTVTYYWVIGESSTVTYGGSGVIDQGSTTGTSASTSKLNCGTKYYLRVYAKSSCDGTSSGYKTSSSFNTSTCTTTCITPGTPSTATVSSIGQTSANLSWTAGSPAGSSNVTYYWVIGESSTVSYGGSGVIDQGSTSGLSASTSALSCNKTYYFRVYAKTSCDNTISAYKTSASFTTSACSNNTILYGIDVSHYQGTINWTQVKNLGYKDFAYVKATEGFDYNDAKFNSNMINGNNAGVIMGAYHVARPDNNSAIDEANHFVDIAGSFIGNNFLPPALDLEPTYVEASGKANLSNWVQTWINQVKSRTSVTPIIYTTHYDAANLLNNSLNIYGLWIANYENNPTTAPTNLGIWSTWTFNQYSEVGVVPGITGNVDLDVFNGNKTALSNLTGGNVNAPTNDDPCNATELTISSSDNFTQGTNINATNSSIPDITCDGSNCNGDVWYKFKVPSSGKAVINLKAGTINDMGMAIYSGINCSSLSYIGCYANGSTFSPYMPNASLTGLTPNSTIWIRLWEYNNNNFGDFSIGLSPNTTGLADFNVNNIKLYPNPTTGKFEISDLENMGQKFKLEVSDIHGKIIYSSIYSENNNKIFMDLSSYPDGLYFIKLITDDEICFKKLIKR